MSGISQRPGRDCHEASPSRDFKPSSCSVTPGPSILRKALPRDDVWYQKAGLRDPAPRRGGEGLRHQRRQSETAEVRRRSKTLSFLPRTSGRLAADQSPSPPPKSHGHSNYVLDRTPSPAVASSSMKFLGIKSSPPRRYLSPPLLSPSATPCHFGILSPSFRPASVSSIASHSSSFLDDGHGIEYPPEQAAARMPFDRDELEGASPVFDLSAINTSSNLLDVSKVAPGYKGIVADSTWRALHYLITGAGDNLDITDLQAIHENILGIHDIVAKKCPTSWPQRPLKHTLGLYPSMTTWEPMPEALTDPDIDSNGQVDDDDKDDTGFSVLNRAEISRIAKAAFGLEEYVESHHTPTRTPTKSPSPHEENNHQSHDRPETTVTTSGSVATPKPRTVNPRTPKPNTTIPRTPKERTPAPSPIQQASEQVSELVVAEAEKLCVQLTAMVKSLEDRRAELDHVYEAFVGGKERDAERLAGLQQQVDELEEDARENQAELNHLRLQLTAIELQIPERQGEDQDPELTDCIANWKEEFEVVKSRWRERRSRNSSFRGNDDSSMMSTNITALTMNSSPIRITRGSSMTSSFRISRGSSFSSPMAKMKPNGKD